MSSGRKDKNYDPKVKKTVLDNYVPSLYVTEDDKRNLSSIDDRKNKEFCEKVISQNETLVNNIAENYQKMTELFSQFNSSLNKLDPLSLCELNLIGETHVRSLTNNRENAPVETGIDSINDVGEIKNRIEELKGLIKANNIQIENENKKINNLRSTSIPEDDDYIKKWTAEKKVNMDLVDEKALIQFTYRKGFKHIYQMKLMKMIFESIFLEKIEEQSVKKYEELMKNSKESSQQFQIRNKVEVYSSVTFEIFKKKCFDAYKFKNQILCYEDWVIDENNSYFYDNNPAPKNEAGKLIRPVQSNFKNPVYDRDFKSISLSNLNLSIDAIRDIKLEALKYEGDEELDKIFLPLIDVVQDMIFIRICKSRLDSHNNTLHDLEKHIESKNRLIQEFNGKIELLNDLFKKLSLDGEQKVTNSHNNPVLYNRKSITEEVQISDVKIRDTKKTISELKNLKNLIEKNYYDMMKSVGRSVISVKDLNKN